MRCPTGATFARHVRQMATTVVEMVQGTAMTLGWWNVVGSSAIFEPWTSREIEHRTFKRTLLRCAAPSRIPTLPERGPRDVVSAADAIRQPAQRAFSRDNFRFDSGVAPRAVVQTQRLARQNDGSLDALTPGLRGGRRISCVSWSAGCDRLEVDGG
jgi:hypothetical protein